MHVCAKHRDNPMLLGRLFQWTLPPPPVMVHALCTGLRCPGGIALPPVLLRQIRREQGAQLMLVHLTTDSLCQWHPRDSTLHAFPCKYCIVDRETCELRHHFGACEHSYGHWIDLDLPEGRFPFWWLLREKPKAANPKCRDVAPLRLVSWLSCEVPVATQKVLGQLMLLFGRVDPASADQVFAIGYQHLQVATADVPTWDMIRDALIHSLAIGGRSCPTDEVGRIMVAFLQRLPLPHLVHFLDMILPQMVPVMAPCHLHMRRFASSYRVEKQPADGHPVEYRLQVCKMFWSLANIMHISSPLLLLATARIAERNTASFQWEGGPPYDRQKIQMGLRKGNTVLVHFRSGNVCYQCVLIMIDAELRAGKPKQGQRKYWRYVSPQRTYFAWLPENLARAFCFNALQVHPQVPYGEVRHLEPGADEVYHSMLFQNIYHIGGTKSAQELEVFLRMPRERLRLGCGIQCTDSIHPLGPKQRTKLYIAALRLLRFAIGIESAPIENEEQYALQKAMLPLLRLADGHSEVRLGTFRVCFPKESRNWSQFTLFSQGLIL